MSNGIFKFVQINMKHLLYQQLILMNLMKLILTYTLNKYPVHWLSSFKHLKLTISIKIPHKMASCIY